MTFDDRLLYGSPHTLFSPSMVYDNSYGVFVEFSGSYLPIPVSYTHLTLPTICSV